MEIRPRNLSCSVRGNEDACYRCLHCYGPHWWCQSCLIKSHIHPPFHRPQCWKDGSFENVHLSDLGYVFVLGHSSSEGDCCPEEDNLFGDRRMTFVHVNGVFDHCVHFCRCPGALSDYNSFSPIACFPPLSTDLKPHLRWIFLTTTQLILWNAKRRHRASSRS